MTRYFAGRIVDAHATDRDAAKAQRAIPHRVTLKRVELAGQRLVMVSAHDLLAALSDADMARPGHVTG